MPGIEETLGALTTALNRNSDLLEKIVASGTRAAANSPSPTPQAASESGSPTVAANEGRSEQTNTEAKRGRGRPAGSTNKPKPPTEADLRGVFGGYLSVDDKGERETRKANVKAILDHFGVSKATELPEENRADAIAYVKQFAAGETPNFMDEGDEGEEEEGDDDSLV